MFDTHGLKLANQVEFFIVPRYDVEVVYGVEEKYYPLLGKANLCRLRLFSTRSLFSAILRKRNEQDEK